MPKNFSHHEYNISDVQYWHKFHNLEYSESLYQIKRHFLTTWSTSTQVLATWLSNDRMHSYPRAWPCPFVFVFLDQMKHSFHVPECYHLALLCCNMHNAHLFLQSQLLPHKEQALSPSTVMINQVDCHHFWIIINCYLLPLLTWVLLNHSHEAHYIRQMFNFFFGHNIHMPIHGICNQLFLYSQSNQAECCHLVMLFSASAKLWKASSCLFICLPVWPFVRLSTYNNSASSGQIFVKFHIWVFFESLSRKSKLHRNLTRIMSTLHEDHCTFWSYLALIFLEWEMFQIKVVEKITTHFSVNNFF